MIHEHTTGRPTVPGGQGQATAQAHQEAQLAYAATGDKAFLAADEFFTTTFTALNGSGVTGEALVGYDEKTHTLTVAINASGLEPNMPHIQHIHGFPDGTDAMTPTSALDTDGDGFIELAEGATSYGPILLNLSTDHTNGTGSDNGHDHNGDLTGFPTAPDGNIFFIESYVLPEGMLGTDPMLALREIVIHGESVPEGAGAGTGGEVDGTAGYKLVLPVASGELSQVYTAANLRTFLHDTDFSSGFGGTGMTHHDHMFG